MVSLCRNRTEDFGPHSSIHPHLPTSCFLDVVVVPLPTWIFLAFLLAFLPQRLNPRRRRRASSILKPTKPIENERTQSLEHEAPRPALHTRVLTALHPILVATMVVLVSLEIAQLSNAHIGIGLLPFNYAGFIAAMANRLRWRTRMARLENAVFWVFLGTVLTLKVATEVIESDLAAGGDNSNERSRPAGEQIIVVSVMVGLSFALAVLEFAGWTGLGHAT